MKKLVVGLMIVTSVVSTSAFAQGHGHHHGDGTNLLVPLVIGGAIGYAMSNNARPQYQPQPQVIYQYNPHVQMNAGQYCQNSYFVDQNGVYHTIQTCTR